MQADPVADPDEPSSTPIVQPTEHLPPISKRDSQVIKGTLSLRQYQIKECYTEQLKQGPISGHLTLQFDIEDGQPVFVEISVTGTLTAALRSCVGRRTKQWSFRGLSDDVYGVEVVYSLQSS